MNKVRVNKEDLLAKLRANRAEHESDYKESKENYQKELVELLTTMLRIAKAGLKVETDIDLPEPVEYLNAYDRAIAMLEVSLDAEVELDANQFAQYWMDEWHWRDQFFASNSTYSQSVATKMNRR
jgi:hypothetical protein